MTNNQFTKSQRRTINRRSKRAREAQARAAAGAMSSRTPGPKIDAAIGTSISPVAAQHKILRGLSAAERRALSRSEVLGKREIEEIRQTNVKTAELRQIALAQRDARLKLERDKRRKLRESPIHFN